MLFFFRLGDFYEMFFEDAETASRILDIALTSRNKNEDSAVPLCGVPYHSAEPYIRKLLDAGHKVAVCEQVEDPKTAKGVVQRKWCASSLPAPLRAPTPWMLVTTIFWRPSMNGAATLVWQ